ncbi:S-layer homology domain-containing protein [Sporosarcina sp. ACRSL]|uniref:C40 family peptidase n=1 Tax=Sporosarcina sp. ACRSL TaxID=2918215 RepID=UPI001EF47D3A|nr:C40 family peptidase [Sporosarcina sp. ACRSL]MCG7342674.1 S-layer homology domain-containing protein [Sporosarcina sp. ACRSL]
MKNRFMQFLIAVFIIAAVPFTTSNTASAASSNEIAAYAQKFIGTPYKFGGTTPSGFDCSGYIRYVFNNFNINLPRTSADQFRVGKSVAKDELQPGDLVFFANTYKKGISHTGIYLGNDEFISAKSRGVMKANIKTDPYWSPKYAGAKRISTVKVAFDEVEVKSTVPMSETFKDLPLKHLAHDAIIALNKKGIINGYLDGTFRPENSITRAHAATMINRELKLKATTELTFKDVSPNYAYYDDIAALVEAGIFQGYSTEEFGVNDNLTRAHLAAIVDRAFDLQEKLDSESQEVSSYKDVPTTHWASESTQALKTLDQTEVFQTDNFNLGKKASRAEFSAAIFSAISEE